MRTDEARQFLDRFPRFEVKPGLTRIQQLLDTVDHPNLAYSTLHVGGTNGKGSVVAMLDAVLRSAGFSVGRFTSPELIDFRDRIVVNGEWISKEDLAAGVAQMAPAIEALDEIPSQFEVIAALAFQHLACSSVDIGVIEVGLGGRFDATNVVHPELAILTNVTLDHQAILGDTVEAIAWEKAGIAKPGVPLLAGGLSTPIHDIVRTECEAVGAILTPIDDIKVKRISRNWDAAAYEVEWDGEVRNIVLPLIGSLQRDNLRLALGAIRELRARNFVISDEAIVKGLRSVRWPGRLEVVRKRPTVLLDGAHNPAAVRALASDIVDLIPNFERRFLLYGTLTDKDADASLAILRDVFPAISLCASHSPRALPVASLVEKAQGYFQRITQYRTIAEGIESWLAGANAEDVLVITGSLTMVGEARRWLTEEI
jgi:dihydrofolate synthase/folylpolyglutamate synthase